MIELDEFASFLGRSEAKVNDAAGVADGKRGQRRVVVPTSRHGL